MLTLPRKHIDKVGAIGPFLNPFKWGIGYHARKKKVGLINLWGIKLIVFPIHKLNGIWMIP